MYKRQFLYYVNTDGTDLVKQEAKSLEGDPKEAVSYLLDALQEKTDTIDYKSAFPQKVTVEDVYKRQPFLFAVRREIEETRF